MNNRDYEVLFTCLGLVFFFIAMVAVLSIINGYVISQLWTWFIVPVFESAPRLSIVEAIGLGMVVTYMTQPPNLIDSRQSKNDKIANLTWTIIGKPVLSLVIGYIVVQFM